MMAIRLIQWRPEAKGIGVNNVICAFHSSIPRQSEFTVSCHFPDGDQRLGRHPLVSVIVNCDQEFSRRTLVAVCGKYDV